jgi:hypothetical protein
MNNDKEIIENKINLVKLMDDNIKNKNKVKLKKKIIIIDNKKIIIDIK